MVIFTETMAKLVSELSDKPLKVTVSEETVVFEFNRTMVGRLRKNGSPETKYRRGKEPKRVKKG